MRIILTALKAPSSRLPIPIEDSTYYDSVRVRGASASVPVGNADLFSILQPFAASPDIGDDSDVESFSSLCRGGTDNKDACEPDVGKLLYHLVRIVKPKIVIEVGVFQGAASCHLALALQRNANQAELHLVDISPDYLEAARKNLSKFDLTGQVFFHCGDSAELARVGKLPETDMVFLDGDHARKSVGRDIESYWPITRDGGLLGKIDNYVRNLYRAREVV